jgi:hypothetical protein
MRDVRVTASLSGHHARQVHDICFALLDDLVNDEDGQLAGRAAEKPVPEPGEADPGG